MQDPGTINSICPFLSYAVFCFRNFWENNSESSATVTINGDTIANVDAIPIMNARPADYVFTRTEIETFLAEHVSPKP